MNWVQEPVNYVSSVPIQKISLEYDNWQSTCSYSDFEQYLASISASLLIIAKIKKLKLRQLPTEIQI